MREKLLFSPKEVEELSKDLSNLRNEMKKTIETRLSKLDVLEEIAKKKLRV